MARVVQLKNLPPTIDITPGTQQRFVLALTNTGAVVDQFTLSLSGLDSDWYTLEPSSITLFPGASGQAEISVYPPAGSSAAAGAYPIRIEIASVSTPEGGATFSSVVNVGTVGTLDMEVRPSMAQGRSAAFRIMWHNHTNAAITVELEARDTEEGLRYRIEPEGGVEVAAGSSQTVEVAVRPEHRETIGEPHRYQITFRGLRPGTTDLLDGGLARPAQFTYLPRLRALALPAWLRRLPMWALLLLLLLAFLLVFLAGNRAGPHILASPLPTATARPVAAKLPRVGRFAIRNGPGGATLAWAVDGARSVRIDGATVAPSGQEAVAQLPDGPIVLEASGADGSAVKLLSLPRPIVRTLPTAHLQMPSIDRFRQQTGAQKGVAELVWHSTGADVVTLDGVAVALGGHKTLSASAAQRQHVLRARNALGTVSAVLAPPASPGAGTRVVVQLPTISRFALAHRHMGQPYRVVWSTGDAGTVTLNGRRVAAQGSEPLPSPVHNARYVLVVANAEGSLTGRIILHVR